VAFPLAIERRGSGVKRLQGRPEDGGSQRPGRVSFVRRWHTAIALLLLFLVAACGSTVRSYKRPGFNAGASSRKLEVRAITTSGAVSIQRARMGAAVSSTQAMAGQDQAMLAAQDVAFELGSIGFSVVDTPGQADVFADFSIGTVRYDPLTGWIADRAFLEFRLARTAEVLASYRSEVRWVTPTIGNLVSNILDRVRRDVGSRE
jgi:hypothetical protein